MTQVIIFIILVFLVGMVWGAALFGQIIQYRIKRGKLPKILKDHKSEIMELIKQGGDAHPGAPGSGPGLRLKAKGK